MSDDLVGDLDIANPGRTYVPSGKPSPSSLRTYAFFVPIIALLIQIPLGLSHALVGFCLRYASGVYVVIAPLLFGGIAFVITGAILSYSLGAATRAANCQSTSWERGALAATIALALAFRVLVTAITLEFISVPQAVHVKTPMDLPTLYWVETLLSLGIVSVAAFAFLPKMRPYCEICGSYMAKQQHLFAESDLTRVLSEISQGAPQVRAWTPTKILFPSTQLEVHVCDQCHSGFVKVDSNTVTMKDGKEQRVSKSVYADQCQPEAMESLLNALREKVTAGA